MSFSNSYTTFSEKPKETRDEQLAQFRVETSKFKVPLENRGVKSDAPELTGCFYFDCNRYKDTVSQDDRINLCEVDELPKFRDELLNRRLDIDLAKGFYSYYAPMQRLMLCNNGNTDVTKFDKTTWLSWIHARDQEMCKEKATLEEVIGAKVLTDESVLKILLMHPLHLNKPYLLDENKFATIIGQKVCGVYFFYRIVKSGDMQKHSSEARFCTVYAGLKFEQEVTTRPEKFQGNSPFSYCSVGSFINELKPKAGPSISIRYFKPIQCVDSAGMPLDLQPTVGSPDTNIHEVYASLKLLGSDQYVVGIKKEQHARNEHRLQKVEMRKLSRLEGTLSNNWRRTSEHSDDAGFQCAYEFLNENIRLLDKYDEGYLTLSHPTVRGAEFNIEVYQGGDDFKHGLSFKSITQIRKEYSASN